MVQEENFIAQIVWWHCAIAHYRRNIVWKEKGCSIDFIM